MTSLVTTLTETLRYRGAIGQWSWVLHRLTGLGVVLFLTLHVVDTSWAVFYPELYVEAVAAYQSPLFTIGEFGLVAAVVYHALNGLRIILFDYRPQWWKHQQRAAWVVIIATGVLLLPVFALMMGHVIDHYNGTPLVLPLNVVLIKQLPFLVGGVVAGLAALLLSGLYGLLFGANAAEQAATSGGGRGGANRVERFWWSFMRVSGLLIVPLVFGHLAMMHVVQGVFDLTMAGHPVVGTGLVNQTGTAVEFVARRWNFALGGVFVWRVYDLALLALVTVHGFNGLRTILTDYLRHPFLKRTAIYLCVIGAVVLLVTGAGALVFSIDEQALRVAENAMRELERLYQ